MSTSSGASRLESVANSLLLLCIAASSFTAVSRLPYVGNRVQPAEVVFLVLLPCALIAYGRDLLPPRRWMVIFGAYLLANVCSALASGERDSILESLGRGYLLALMAIVTAYVRKHRATGPHNVALAWLAGALLLAVIGLAGYALAVFGYDNTNVRVFANYPYLGSVVRLAGFTTGPGMLVIALTFPILWLWTIETSSRARWIGLAILVLAALLSLSKEIVLVAMGMALLHPLAWKRSPAWRTAAVIGLAVVFWAGSHCLVIFNGQVHDSYLAGTPYTSERVLISYKNLQIVETSYLALKRANLAIGVSHPLLGVGPGNSNTYLPALRARHLFPERVPDYDPHSTWMGAFSETGLLGLMTLTVMVASWFSLVRKQHLLSSTDAGVRAAGVYLLILLIESVIIDAMNFRQLWIAVGLIMACSSTPRLPERIFSRGVVDPAVPRSTM